MNLIERMGGFPWAHTWRALTLLLEIAGIAGIVTWFSRPAPWWMVLPEIVLLFTAFGVCFIALGWWRERQYREEMRQAQADIDRRIARIRAGSYRSGYSRRAIDRVAFMVVLCGFASLPVKANPLSHIGHYVRTHKELLAYDAIVIAGPMADSATTQHGLNSSPYWVETDPILPTRPTALQNFGLNVGLSVGLVAAGHIAWHFFPHGYAKQMLPILAVPVAIGEAEAGHHNVVILDEVQK